MGKKKAGSKTDADKYQIHAGWGTVILMILGFLFCVWCLHDLHQNPRPGMHGLRASIITFLIATPFVIIAEARGYILSREHFTVTWLGIPIDKTSWEHVAQVVYVKYTKKGCSIGLSWRVSRVNQEMICVVIKPADPLPHEKYDLLRKHWWSNFLLVGNIHFMNPETKGKAYLEAFREYWGEVEIREYDE